jgi:hypothetical protein
MNWPVIGARLSVADNAARDRHYVHVRVPLLVQRVLERLHVKTSTVYMTFESFERSLR